LEFIELALKAANGGFQFLDVSLRVGGF